LIALIPSGHGKLSSDLLKDVRPMLRKQAGAQEWIIFRRRKFSTTYIQKLFQFQPVVYGAIEYESSALKPPNRAGFAADSQMHG
jgi:hypothetical protein